MNIQDYIYGKKQFTEAEAIKFGNGKEWEKLSVSELAAIGLFQRLLCLPYVKFHEAIEKHFKRPVFTHEFGLNYEGLQKEYFGTIPAPTMEQIIDLIPEEKRILIN